MTDIHPNDQTINDYVDNRLSDAARAEIEHHLENCGHCFQLVAELRDICHQAAGLEPMEPPERAWKRIEAAVRERANEAKVGRTRSERAWPLITGLAAAVLLLTTLAGIQYLRLHSVTSSGSLPASNTRELAESVEAELRDAEQHYQKAIDGLEQIANAQKGALDSETAAVLLKNLALVDRAISDSRAALTTDPDSIPARHSLLEGLKTKVTLLQDTVALINEMRKGNESEPEPAPADTGPRQRG